MVIYNVSITVHNHSLYLQWHIGRIEMLRITNCLNQSKVTQSWCQKWNASKIQIQPQPQPQLKNTCGDHFGAHINLLQSSIILKMRQWEGQAAVKFLNHSKSTQYWCGRGLLPKLSPPTARKSGCGDSYTWWIQISTLHNHSLHLQWDIGRVHLLWIDWISPKSLNLGVKSGIQIIQAKPNL